VDLAGGSNVLGGWPMVQKVWDESKFALLPAIGLARLDFKIYDGKYFFH
jgi:hypothetical protein